MRRIQRTPVREVMSGAVLTAVLLLTVTTGQAQVAADARIKGDNASLPWSATDGAKATWDIDSSGQVTSRANSPYGMGMRLTISGNPFSVSATCRISADKREIELGPWNWNSINIYRRIYVDPKLGYCRWIDVFENNSGSDQSLQIRYVTNTSSGTKEVLTSANTRQIGNRDWAYASASVDTARSALVHVFGSKGAKDLPQPQFALNSGELFYNCNLTVPNGKTVALCFFEAQVPDMVKAWQFMKNFSPSAEMAKVPPGLRKCIVNMVAPRLSLGNIELPRNDRLDLVVQPDGNELLGTLLTDPFVLQTMLGKLELPASRVVGLYVPADDDPYLQVVLTDGQVVAGRLDGAPLRLRLESGSDMSFAPGKFRAASFRISKDRPQELTGANPLVVLQDGQRLSYSTTGQAWTLRTLYGELKVDPLEVSTVSTQTAEGGLHRVMFRNGSVLSGLVAPQKFSLKLDLGMPLEISLGRVTRFDFPGQTVDDPKGAHATLRNQDELYGTLLDQEISVQTESSKVTVRPADILIMDFSDESLGLVEMRIITGKNAAAVSASQGTTTIRGTMVNTALRFKIEPGPEITVPLSLLDTVAMPGAEALEPAPASASPSPAAGAAEAPRRDKLAKLAAMEADERAMKIKEAAIAKETAARAAAGAAAKREATTRPAATQPAK